MLPLYISLGAVGAIILILLLLAVVSYNFAFGKRADKNPLLKYFTADEFNLTDRPVSAQRGKVTLNGYIYRNERTVGKKDAVVFCHGMGAGHVAYTTEIAYFCSLGYPVVALDSMGCNMSQGKQIGGMYEGVKTASLAIDVARKEFPDGKIFVVGHSWGAYSALIAGSEKKADKIIAISAPDSFIKTIYGAASGMISKPLAGLLCPFWYIIALLRYGKNAHLHASKRAGESGIPTLLIHGDKDCIVKDGKSAFYAGDYANFTKYLAEGKAHNPYNTVEAEAKLAELSSALRKAKTTDKSYFSSFDYKSATEEDTSVMQVMADFLEKT